MATINKKIPLIFTPPWLTSFYEDYEKETSSIKRFQTKIDDQTKFLSEAISASLLKNAENIKNLLSTKMMKINEDICSLKRLGPTDYTFIDDKDNRKIINRKKVKILKKQCRDFDRIVKPQISGILKMFPDSKTYLENKIKDTENLVNELCWKLKKPIDDVFNLKIEESIPNALNQQSINESSFSSLNKQFLKSEEKENQNENQNIQNEDDQENSISKLLKKENIHEGCLSESESDFEPKDGVSLKFPPGEQFKFIFSQSLESNIKDEKNFIWIVQTTLANSKIIHCVFKISQKTLEVVYFFRMSQSNLNTNNFYFSDKFFLFGDNVMEYPSCSLRNPNKEYKFIELRLKPLGLNKTINHKIFHFFQIKGMNLILISHDFTFSILDINGKSIKFIYHYKGKAGKINAVCGVPIENLVFIGTTKGLFIFCSKNLCAIKKTDLSIYKAATFSERKGEIYLALGGLAYLNFYKLKIDDKQFTGNILQDLELKLKFEKEIEFRMVNKESCRNLNFHSSNLLILKTNKKPLTWWNFKNGSTGPIEIDFKPSLIEYSEEESKFFFINEKEKLIAFRDEDFHQKL